MKKRLRYLIKVFLVFSLLTILFSSLPFSFIQIKPVSSVGTSTFQTKSKTSTYNVNPTTDLRITGFSQTSAFYRTIINQTVTNYDGSTISDIEYIAFDKASKGTVFTYGGSSYVSSIIPTAIAKVGTVWWIIPLWNVQTVTRGNSQMSNYDEIYFSTSAVNFTGYKYDAYATTQPFNFTVNKVSVRVLQPNGTVQIKANVTSNTNLADSGFGFIIQPEDTNVIRYFDKNGTATDLLVPAKHSPKELEVRFMNSSSKLMEFKWDWTDLYGLGANKYFETVNLTFTTWDFGIPSTIKGLFTGTSGYGASNNIVVDPTLTVSSSASEWSVVNTWDSGTKGYNFTAIQSKMVIDRLYDYQIGNWVWNGDQSDDDSSGFRTRIVIDGVTYRSNLVGNTDWTILENSDTRVRVRVWGTHTSNVTFTWEITVYAGQRIWMQNVTAQWKHSSTQTMDSTGSGISDLVQGDTYQPSIDADLTDDVFVTNATYGGYGIGTLWNGGSSNPVNWDLDGSNFDELRITHDVDIALSQNEIVDYTLFWYIHSQTVLTTAVSLTDQYDNELADSFASISSVSGATYSGRNNQTGAFDFTTTNNGITFTLTPVGTESNFTAIHIDNWASSTYAVYEDTKLTEDTGYYAYYNSTSTDLDIVFANPVASNIAIRSIHTLALQGKDTSSTNIPRVLSYKITHPNNSITTTSSGASANLVATTEYGSHTINTWWGTHLTNASLSITVTATTTKNINTKIRRLDSASNYLLFSLNNTDLTTPTIQGDADWAMLAVTATGTIPFKMDNANWKRTDEPDSFTVGASQYTKGTGSWAFSNNVFTFNVEFSTKDLSMTWLVSGGGGGGGGGGGYVPPAELPPIEEELPEVTPPYVFLPIIPPQPAVNVGIIGIVVFVAVTVVYGELTRSKDVRSSWRRGARQFKILQFPKSERKQIKWSVGGKYRSQKWKRRNSYED